MTVDRQQQAPETPRRQGPVRRFFVELFKYLVLIGLGGLLALFSSYIMRQLGF